LLDEPCTGDISSASSGSLPAVGQPDAGASVKNLARAASLQTLHYRSLEANTRGIAQNLHIHSRTLSKWRDFLSAAQLREFERRRGDLIVNLGYELCAADARPATGADRGAAQS